MRCKAEIDSFLDCIRTGRAPVVSGEAGLIALETAIRITEQVESLARRSARHGAGAAPAGARAPEGRAAMSSRITAPGVAVERRVIDVRGS